jgi:hypothetical protein
MNERKVTHRGFMLPFVEYDDDSMGLGIPSIIDAIFAEPFRAGQRSWDSVKAKSAGVVNGDYIDDTGQQYSAGNPSLDAFMAGSLAPIGGVAARAAPEAATVPRAALAANSDEAASLPALARALESELPMDQASRMARARDIGYRSEPVYHGTAVDFDAFSLARGGEVSGSRAGSVGVSVSPDAGVANEFAALAAGETADGSRVLPLMYRTSRQGTLALDGTEKNFEVAATLQDAWSSGFDSVRLLNYSTPDGSSGKEVIVVREPNQLRSVNAAFDPARANSANLLASNPDNAAAVPMLARAFEEWPQASESMDDDVLSQMVKQAKRSQK